MTDEIFPSIADMIVSSNFENVTIIIHFEKILQALTIAGEVDPTDFATEHGGGQPVQVDVVAFSGGHDWPMRMDFWMIYTPFRQADV